MNPDRRFPNFLAIAAIAGIAGAAFADVEPGLARQTEAIVPSPLLAIDQNRSTVIDRIVADWGAVLERSNAGISATQLREMLSALRADHLLAASLAGSASGLRDVLATALVTTSSGSALPARGELVAAKVLGDANQDLVYTPVGPCRLLDTRASQGGLGALQPGVRRTFGATAPVASQGGPGGCVAGAGAAVALLQIGTVAPSGSGLVQGGPQGAASFQDALILYQSGDQYGTAVAMPLNAANGRFDLQVLFAATDVYADLLGYFKPATGFVASVTGGTGITVTGTTAPTLSLPPAYQLPQACTNGQVAKSNGTGGWTCAADNNSGGTVTSLTPGSGITLTPNPITATGSIAADTAFLQRRVSGTCVAGSSIRTVNADGTVVCDAGAATATATFTAGFVNPVPTTPWWTTLSGDQSQTANGPETGSPLSISCTFDSLTMTLYGVSGTSAADTITVTLYKNRVATAMGCLASNVTGFFSTCTDTTHTVAVVGSDTLSLGFTQTDGAPIVRVGVGTRCR